MMNLMTVLVKKVFISSKPSIVCLLCPPPCGPFSIQESAVGGLSYKVKNNQFHVKTGYFVYRIIFSQTQIPPGYNRIYILTAFYIFIHKKTNLHRTNVHCMLFSLSHYIFSQPFLRSAVHIHVLHHPAFLS